MSRLVWLFFLALAASMPGSTIAQDSALQKLLMPGRVIEGHAEIENQCASCHTAQSSVTSSSLCLTCHENIGVDREDGTGFHGKMATAKNNDCVACHTDHEGRDADIVNRNDGLFDHRFTDFTLEFAHADLSCASCHAADAKFHEAPLTCAGCHGNDDPHAGTLGTQCVDCHTAKNWFDYDFDHADTGYPLTGGHAQVACVDCHRGNQFANTSRTCSSCHAVDDVHKGTKPGTCASCHTTASWSSLSFDHALETGFALLDGHADLSCGSCHQREDHKDDFSDGCVACHRSDDSHQTLNGQECGSCHKPTVWSEGYFDHTATGFELLGGHQGLDCQSCHTQDISIPIASECSSCHLFDDAHAGSIAQDCGSCHAADDWKVASSFDHDLSSFPLIGLHAVASCGSCHTDTAFGSTESTCASCHADDDVHKGALGNECASCHLPNGWELTRFDHNTSTDFPLFGSHKGLDCGSCHTSDADTRSDVPSSCGGCHADDDIHEGAFGNDCGSCHNSSSFSELEKAIGSWR